MKFVTAIILLLMINDSFSQMVDLVKRPFAEYEQTGFLIMSENTYIQTSEDIRDQIAAHIPEGVILVVMVNSDVKSRIQGVRDHYLQFIRAEQLRVVYVSTHGFWARDALPIPVITSSNHVELIDAIYYRQNEPDQRISEIFNVPLVSHMQKFEGGNFLADTKKNCLMVANERLPDKKTMAQYYGCSELVILPYQAGIGHIDERVKFLSDTIAITDEPSYITSLENLGYTVTLFPRPVQDIRNRPTNATYINSILLNNRILMPIFGDEMDQRAQDLYAQLGFEVAAINTQHLSEYGRGSLHCMTMNYPVLSALGVD